ncbi:MAG: hypothetical protein EPN93_12770 [Spirochaetes bacterium]|nr:MAG: hypothetical protein EPN93_12770 [Spirochaetota bacterium]
MVSNPNSRTKILIVPIILFFIQSAFVLLPPDLKTPADLITLLGNLNYQVKIFLFVTLIGLYVLYQKWALQGEVRLFSKFIATRPQIIESRIRDLAQVYSKHSIDLRVNVMIAKRRILIWKRLCNWHRPFIMTTQFDTVFHYNMNRDMDKNLQLTINQGVAGLAYREGQIVVDLEKVDRNEFSLTKEQLKATEDIKFIMSTPIFEIDLHTMRLTNKIIGVVNIDSKNNTFDELEKRKLLEKLFENSNNISEFVALLH